MSKCVICGRPLKTGRKYCYVCRSIQKAEGKRKKGVNLSKLIIIFVTVTFLYISSFFNSGFPNVLRSLMLIICIIIFLVLLIELVSRSRKKKLEGKN